MKVTLDHNCIIDLENGTDIGTTVRAILRNARYQCFVVNIGATEMLEKGVRPDQYETFEVLLHSAGIAHLPRLDPMLIWGVTFWGKSIYASDERIKLSDVIWDALFGNSPKIDIAMAGLGSSAGKKWLNRICDVQSMWCHIQNSNDVFLTTDGNFTRETKLPRLLALGAGRICRPCDL